MVVPPAADGTVGNRSSTLRIITAGFALVIVVCLGVLAVVHFTGGDILPGGATSDAEQAAQDDADVREKVMAQADQFVLRLNTYGPGYLDAQNQMPKYADSVREVITSKFAADFDKNLTFAEQTVSQSGYARTAELFATGVDSVDVDTAQVLVAGSIKGSYPDPKHPTKGRLQYAALPFRFQVTLIKTEGDWLVDDFKPITGDQEQSTPSAPPTVPPTTPSSRPSSPQSGDAP